MTIGPDVETGNGGRAARMRAVMTDRFRPVRLVLEDESARHAGHAGLRESGTGGGGSGGTGGETHYAMLVVSDAFSGLSRVQRSRLVHEALDVEFRAGLHALSLTLRTPDEHANDS